MTVNPWRSSKEDTYQPENSVGADVSAAGSAARGDSALEASAGRGDAGAALVVFMRSSVRGPRINVASRKDGRVSIVSAAAVR